MKIELQMKRERVLPVRFDDDVRRKEQEKKKRSGKLPTKEYAAAAAWVAGPPLSTDTSNKRAPKHYVHAYFVR